MLRNLLSIKIVCLTLGVNIVRLSEMSSEGVPTVFSAQDLSTTLEMNRFDQHRESPRPAKKKDGVSDENGAVFEKLHQINTNGTTNSLSVKIEPEMPFFWTASSAADDSVLQFTGSNESLTSGTNIEFYKDTHSNNRTNKRDRTTQSSGDVLDSKHDNGQSDEVNQLISKQTADDSIFVFYFILRPLVAVVGCVCNTFNIIVLSKQGLGESTSCYLLVMSLADFAYLLFVLVLLSLTLLKNYSYSEYAEWATWMHYDLFNRYFVIVSGRISNYIVAVLSIERFIAVRFPLRIKFTPLSLYPKKIISGVCVFVSALVLPNIFRTEFVSIHDPHSNSTITKYTLTKFHNSNQEFYVYYTYFILTFLRVLPVLAVFFFNLGIITVLKGSSTNLINMSAGDTKRQVKQIRITRMLVTIAVIFLICMLPGLVHSLISVLYRPYYSDNQNLWATVNGIFPLFDIINSTVNFIVYIILSEKFSAIFINTFCQKCKKREPTTAPVRAEQEAALHM